MQGLALHNDVISGVSLCQNFGMVFLNLRLQNVILTLVGKSVGIGEMKLSRIEMLWVLVFNGQDWQIDLST